MDPADLSHCYGCGADNPIGLHLKKSYVGGRAHIELDVKPEFNSYPGLMHGGLTCVLMDEVMYYAIARLGIEAVTTTMAVDYKAPALVGQHLVCEAWIRERQGRHIEVLATIAEAKSKRIIAEGRGSFLEIDMKRFMERWCSEGGQ
jgi:uncharacterized protein (TIGR00369 family)